MVRTESVGDLSQFGRDIIRGCAGSISYTRESEGPFQGRFKGIQINCQVCGIASAGLGEPLLGMSVPISKEEVPQETKQFLNYFCGISRGVVTRRAVSVSIESQVQASQNSVILKELGLTPRPGEVLNRMLHGQDIPQITKEMSIEKRTTYRYLVQIRRALGVRTTFQALAKAYEMGFGISYPNEL